MPVGCRSGVRGALSFQLAALPARSSCPFPLSFRFTPSHGHHAGARGHSPICASSTGVAACSQVCGPRTGPAWEHQHCKHGSRTKRLWRAAFTPLAPSSSLRSWPRYSARSPDLSIFNPRPSSDGRRSHDSIRSVASVRAVGRIGPQLDGSQAALRSSRKQSLSLPTRLTSEIYDRLFMISVAVLLLSQLWDERGTLSQGKILWASIFAITLVHAASLVLMQSISAQSHSSMYAGFLTTHDPFWLIEVRRLLRIVPMDLGFGWLYVRYGIESSILANFISAVAASLLLTFVMIHFISNLVVRGARELERFWAIAC